MAMVVDRGVERSGRLASWPSGEKEWTRQEKSGDTRGREGSVHRALFVKDGTGEEYYIDVQTVIEKNGMVDWLSKGVVAQKSRRGCVFFFSRRRRFDVWVAGGDGRGCFR